MTKQSAAIFLILIVALTAIAKYFENKSIDPSHLNPLPIQDENNNDPSLIDIIEFHMNRKKKSNTTRVPADLNENECSMVRKVTEKVKANFAGYVLEFPCTAGSHGSIRTETSDSGEIINQEYTLYLGVQLGDQKDSIWNDRLSNSREGKEGFLIILKSNGEAKPLPLFENFDKYTHVKTDELAGLDIYHKVSDRQSVIALLKNFKDASGNPPSIFCYLDAVDEISDVFSDLYNMSYKYASCSAHWMLTPKISLVVHSFDAQYAYRFVEIYKKINPGIAEIIVKKPD